MQIQYHVIHSGIIRGRQMRRRAFIAVAWGELAWPIVCHGTTGQMYYSHTTHEDVSGVIPSHKIFDSGGIQKSLCSFPWIEKLISATVKS